MKLKTRSTHYISKVLIGQLINTEFGLNNVMLLGIK